MSSFATNTVCEQDALCSRELIKETVDVMNQALHDAPACNDATQAEPLSEKVSNGRTLRVLVFDANDMAKKTTAAIRFDEEQVELIGIGNKAEQASVDGSMRVCEEHLVQVSNNPDTYIEDPLKMELIWVKERMTASENDQ